MKKLAIALAATALLPAAQAATHQLSQTTPVFLTGPHTGQFDIRALLPANQQVTQASILLRFADDIEADFSNTVSTHAYSNTGNRPETQHSVTDGVITYNYATTHVEMLQSVVTNITDLTPETVTAQVGGETRFAGTLIAPPQFFSATTRQLDETNCLDQDWGWAFYFNTEICTLREDRITETTTNASGAVGEFNILFASLGSQALADINLDGLLDFDLQLGQGQDVNLLEARIDFTTAARQGAVPVPSLLSMLGIGVVAMRLQRRKSQP